jgi:hypothetical protein
MPPSFAVKPGNSSPTGTAADRYCPRQKLSDGTNGFQTHSGGAATGVVTGAALATVTNGPRPRTAVRGTRVRKKRRFTVLSD